MVTQAAMLADSSQSADDRIKAAQLIIRDKDNTIERQRLLLDASTAEVRGHSALCELKSSSGCEPEISALWVWRSYHRAQGAANVRCLH